MIRPRGFTFVETMLVAMIIAVLAGAAVPSLRGTYGRLQLEAASRQIAGVMERLNQRSVAEGTVLKLTIDSDHRRYWAQVSEGSRQMRAYSLAAGIGITATQKNIHFYPDGSIDKCTVRISSGRDTAVVLTTEGVYSGVKVSESK